MFWCKVVWKCCLWTLCTVSTSVILMAVPWCWWLSDSNETWATTNNLRLNRAKSKEIVFFANCKRGKQAPIPPPCPTIECIHSLRVLGIIVNAKLTAADHVDHLLSASAIYCTRCAFCAAVELQQIHWTTFFALQFLPKFYTAPQRGPACVLLLIGHA